jgi:uncharacterized protein YjbJ (UPF0337 family)
MTRSRQRETVGRVWGNDEIQAKGDCGRVWGNDEIQAKGVCGEGLVE